MDPFNITVSIPDNSPTRPVKNILNRKGLSHLSIHKPDMGVLGAKQEIIFSKQTFNMKSKLVIIAAN